MCPRMELTLPSSSTPSERLSTRVVKGSLWIFGLRIVNRGLGFIRKLILARLLAPEDYGLFGIALLTLSALETFSQTGSQIALIQKRGNVKSYLDTAWTVAAIRGISISLILFSCAPAIADFFSSPQTAAVIRVISIFPLLQGFNNIGIIFFQKELEFNKQFIYELSVALVGLCVAIFLAFILRNVWALVWGGLVANIVRLFMSYIIHPYRPRVRFDLEKFRDLFSFGKWGLGSGILTFLITQGDDIFVGKILGVSALGLYQVAYLISNLPATEITHVIHQVVFPAYSKLNNDLSNLKDAYLKVLQFVAFLSFPVATLIFILAPDFTIILLGPKWMGIVPVVRVLVLAGLTRSIAATAGTLFYAVGKPKIDTYLQIARFFILAVLIYPFCLKWGLLGISAAVFVSIFVSNLGFSFMVIKITQCGIKAFAKTIAVPLVSATLTLIFLEGIHTAMNTGLWQLLFMAALSICFYLSAYYLSEKITGDPTLFFYRQTVTLLKNAIN
jgi:lipopolysaccharide exporter